jgi:hypothetical protein
MSDGRKVPEHSAPQAGPEGSSSAPQRTVSSPGLPRAVTNPGGMRVMSAARTAPVEKKIEGPVGKRLASEASNQLLNGLSILKEMVQDFRASDRFFKYKAGIVGGWVFISLVSMIIACPGRGVETTDLGARVIVLPNPERPKASPSLTVTNTDDDPWKNVIFVVNGQYRATVERIDAGSSYTLTPKNLLSTTGPMPADERFLSAEMRTDDGSAVLVREGQPVTK